MSCLRLFTVAVALAVAPSAQTADSLATVGRIYEQFDVQPEVVGGMAALAESVAYPESAVENRIEGTVVVQMVISAQGEVVDAVAERSPDEALSDAALSAVRQLRFTPGKVNGQPVTVRLMLPVRFRLPEGLAPPPVPPASSIPREIPQLTFGIVGPDELGIYDVAEVQPELIGGMAAIRPEYPEEARLRNIQGRVIIQFVVDERGEATDLQVIRSPHRLLSEAALVAVRRLRFTPGTVDGEPVEVRFALPVTFRLR